MAKDLSVAILMDFYGGMLTDKRYDVLDMYYNSDMSLAEIAEEIKHGERQLAELEEKLGLAKRFADIKEEISKINDILEHTDDFDGAEKIKEILQKIENNI